MLFLPPVDFLKKIIFIENFFQEYHQSVNKTVWIQIRPDPGSKLFARFISIQHYPIRKRVKVGIVFVKVNYLVFYRCHLYGLPLHASVSQETTPFDTKSETSPSMPMDQSVKLKNIRNTIFGLIRTVYTFQKFFNHFQKWSRSRSAGL